MIASATLVGVALAGGSCSSLSQIDCVPLKEPAWAMATRGLMLSTFGEFFTGCSRVRIVQQRVGCDGSAAGERTCEDDGHWLIIRS